MLVHKVTAVGGRRGRGRAYIPGAPATAIDNTGVVDSAYMVANQPRLTTFGTACATNDIGLVVLHGGEGTLPVPYDVTNLVLDGKVATQRRRLRR